ncbi:MAG: SCO family protein [Chitinophagaceae bacterium]|nr:MAG: SCO family protein [Chitinophagaceae bacterium]
MACNTSPSDPSPADLTPNPSPKERGIPLPLGTSELKAKDAREAQSGDGSASLPYYNTPDFTPHFLFLPDSISMQITHHVGAFRFANQDSAIITDQTVRGKIHVANFMFTSCGSICPVMTSELKKVALAFRNEANVVLLSYSVTPWIDTPGHLRRFRKARGVDSFARWHFLTGKKEAIYQLARRAYFAEEEIGFTRDSSDFLHTEHFVLVDGDGRIRGIYNGTLALETEQLVQDINALLKEKEIATAAQELRSKRI